RPAPELRKSHADPARDADRISHLGHERPGSGGRTRRTRAEASRGAETSGVQSQSYALRRFGGGESSGGGARAQGWQRVRRKMCRLRRGKAAAFDQIRGPCVWPLCRVLLLEGLVEVRGTVHESWLAR